MGLRNCPIEYERTVGGRVVVVRGLGGCSNSGISEEDVLISK